MTQNKQPAVAIIYDRVNTPYGGAEVVLQAVSEIFPGAPIYTSVYHNSKARWVESIKIIPSFLQKIPFATDKHQLLLPLMPLAFESFDLSAYDLLISITSAEAKGVLTKPNQKHICYMLTPTRYLYSHKETYLESKWYLRLPIITTIAQLILAYIRFWDQSASIRPDTIIPISKLVSQRITKYYGIKSAKVVYPPVKVLVSKEEIDALPLFSNTNKFYLSISRLVDYKRIDLSIKACIKLKKPLVVVGTGESEQKLHKLAGANACIKQEFETIEEFLQRATMEEKIICFTGKLPQNSVYKLLKNCEAVLMPGQEDFGITALESGIFGKPVILFYTSGVAELLKNNIHAVYITQESVAEMIYALGKLDTLVFDAVELRTNALKHEVARFKQEFKQRIEQELKGQYVIS